MIATRFDVAASAMSGRKILLHRKTSMRHLRHILTPRKPLLRSLWILCLRLSRTPMASSTLVPSFLPHHLHIQCAGRPIPPALPPRASRVLSTPAHGENHIPPPPPPKTTTTAMSLLHPSPAPPPPKALNHDPPKTPTSHAPPSTPSTSSAAAAT